MALGIVRNVDDAEQVTQDAMVRVMHGLPRLEDRDRYFGWLNRIVVNTAYTFLSRERRGREKTRAVDPVRETSTRASDPVPAFEAMVDGLSVEERALLALRFVSANGDSGNSGDSEHWLERGQKALLPSDGKSQKSPGSR